MSEDNKFSIGMKLSLAINDSDEKLLLTLIGWDEKQFLITKNPYLRGLQITSKDDCIIRFAKDGVAYGFQTAMLSMQYSPAPIIFFKYPETIKSMSFRKSKRVKTNIPSIILRKNKNNQFIKYNVKIVDLSESGCLIEILETDITHDIDVEDKFFVNFKILDKSLELDCVARNVRTKNEVYQIGTQFIGENTIQKETISSFISMIDSQNMTV